MGDCERWRCWDGLNPDVLALIFMKIPSDELARTAPFVCRGWRETLSGPYCWSEIDIEEWCRRVDREDVVDVGVRRLVGRSGRTLRRLTACRIGNSGFSFVASFGKQLQVLQIPRSEVTDLTLQKSASSLTALQVLDISYCNNITHKGIEILGKNCKSLVNFHRNMHSPEYESSKDNGVTTKICEEEALAVGNTMLGLERLELAFGCFSDLGLDVILTNCKALRSLDIRGCWNVELHGDVGLKFNAVELVKDPHYDALQLCPSSDEASSDGVDDISDEGKVD
ncbi:hypothetical protein HPP92_020237 [Vanilla planifolia]|uniref:F-box domain-containing protein n=1 Tax=Vanilla planifolia TaxID=51239 RepID=A0A835Q0C0_VANPL|nr:hypothetical protein HPP92_020648 [Vanilla planifolia]KAG0461761.1 hypothetical protein HPP92_020237 [Vanilla planifolia]